MERFYRWLVWCLVLHASTNFRLISVKGETDHRTEAAHIRMEDRHAVTTDLAEGLSEGRTFAVKRLQFMLLPVMYKMGVMTTLLAVLVVLSLKSLLIGLILLVLKLAAFAAKFASLGQATSHAAVAAPWSPPAQPIHVHVHNDAAHQSAPEQVYATPGWDYYTGNSASPHVSSGYADHAPYYYKG